MLFKTHVAFGILIAILITTFFGTNYLFFALIVLGSVLPDIDKANSKIGKKLGPISFLIEIIFGHRGIIHSLFGAAVICGATYYFFGIYGIALLIGYLSHLLIDGLTVEGVNFFHPFASVRLAGFIKTGKHAELLLFLVFIILNTLLIGNYFRII